MKAIKKAVAVTGKYTNRNGEEKSSYINCGKLMQREDGSLTLKLDALPLGDFNGWINFYDLDENRQQNHQQGMARAQQAAQPTQDISGGVEDDIPFAPYMKGNI